MTLREALRAVTAIVARDATIAATSRFRLAAQTVTALFSVTLFYYLSRLVNVERFPQPDDYFAYVVVGLVILQVLAATLASLPGAIRTELVAGTFERLAVSPLGPAGSVAAMALFPVLSSLLSGVLMIAVATIVYGLDLAGAEAALALPAAALAVLAFLPFAMLAGALVLVSKQAGNVGRLLVVGLALSGGLYFPPELLPVGLRWISDVQPFTPALELLRHLLIGAEVDMNPGAAVLRLILFAVVMAPLAYLVLQRSVRACRRRGTLIEA